VARDFLPRPGLILNALVIDRRIIPQSGIGGSNPSPATNLKLFPFNSFQSGDKKLNERLALDTLQNASFSSLSRRLANQFLRKFQRSVSLQPRMRRVEMLEVPVRQDEIFVPNSVRNGDSRTVAVYTRHKPECPNKGNAYWRKCRCTKHLTSMRTALPGKSARRREAGKKPRIGHRRFGSPSIRLNS
jgi:hypothetical protein